MKKGDWYKIFLLVIFLAFWIWSFINPKYPDVWLMENYLTFVFVPVIILTAFYFRLSNVSYTLITIFMILHVIGSHSSYAEVPFGYILQDWLNESRNMYDRLVHFSFGLLWAYPIREVFLRLAKTKGIWGYYLPFDFTLAFSAAYEIIEWGSVYLFSADNAIGFLGSQGDPWDAQKDMLMVGIGALITMFVTFLINISINKNFWSDFKEGFRIPKDDKPLGEVKIAEFLKQKKQNKAIP